MREKIKESIKKCIGGKRISLVRANIKLIKSKTIYKNKIKTEINEKEIESLEVYEQKRKNVFFGYYDLKQIKENKMLVHVTKKNANTKKDFVEIGYYNLQNNKYNFVTISRAWCWQQGSRLRWSKEKNAIFFNDVNENGYCTKKYDISNMKTLDIIDYPLYDIDNEEEYGISINFSRLQQLRPGYGYNFLKENRIIEKAPNNDGLYIVNIKNKEKKLLISLQELAQRNDKDLQYYHYINHVSISPDGEKIMFFHLWTNKNQTNRKTELCIIDKNGKNFQILEEEFLVSHYTWVSNDELLVTAVDTLKGKCMYIRYKIIQKDKFMIENKNLIEDGHPTFLHVNKFVSDTYPDNISNQRVFSYNINTNTYTQLLKIYSNPMLYDEKRCDLHPRIDNVENRITIDTTFYKKKRSIVLLKLKRME